LVLPKGAMAAPSISLELSALQAPLPAGAPVGRLTVKTGEIVKAQVPVLAAVPVKKRGWLDALFEGVMPLLRKGRGAGTL